MYFIINLNKNYQCSFIYFAKNNGMKAFVNSLLFAVLFLLICWGFLELIVLTDPLLKKFYAALIILLELSFLHLFTKHSQDD